MLSNETKQMCSLLLLPLSLQLILSFVVFFIHQVKVESGKEFVLLPCKTTFYLLEDSKVEWTDRDNRKIHVYHSGSEQPDEQDWLFKDRTNMNEDPLKTGDLSLTVKYPIEWKRDICTCTVYSREGRILVKKQVELKVKGQCCNRLFCVSRNTHALLLQHNTN